MKKAFVLIVLVVLLLPAVGLITPFDIKNHSRDTGLPWGSDVLSRNIGLRTLMLTANGYVSLLLGGTGSERVVKGKDCFLFYRQGLEDTLGEQPMTDQGIELLADNIARLARKLKAEGTKFMLVIAPNKATIYPHKLPYFIQAAPEEGSNRVRLMAALQQAGVNAPDFVPLLRNKSMLTYMKTDTHWSAYGAYLAYEEIWRTLFDEQPPIALTMEDFTVPVPSVGDLSQMVLPGMQPRELDALPNIEKNYRTKGIMRSLEDMLIETIGPKGAPTMFVARDSFGMALFPYLAGSTEKMTFSRNYEAFYSQATGHDAAVLVVVERYLRNQLAYRLDK